MQAMIRVRSIVLRRAWTALNIQRKDLSPGTLRQKSAPWKPDVTLR